MRSAASIPCLPLTVTADASRQRPTAAAVATGAHRVSSAATASARLHPRVRSTSVPTARRVQPTVARSVVPSTVQLQHRGVTDEPPVLSAASLKRGALWRRGSGALVPVVRVTGVLPQLRTLKFDGALMSYHSFLVKGSTL